MADGTRRGSTATGNPDPVGLCDEDGVRIGTTTNPLPSIPTNSAGVEIGTEDAPISIEEVLNPKAYMEYAHRHTGVISTLAVATDGVGTSRIIEIVDATGFIVGNYIQISDGSIEPTFAEIMVITLGATDILELDRFVDLAHPIGTSVEVVDFGLEVLGTRAAPVEYIVRPEGTTVVHIQRLTLSMILSTAGDMGLFGNLARLTNGVLLRERKNGVYRTLTLWKDNDEINDDTYDVTFDGRSGGNGSHGMSSRWTFERFGSEVRLNAATNDQLEVYIQDDLTGLGHFSIKAQGHYK